MDAAGQHEPDGERAASQKSPDAFRTISEVSTDLDVPQHVLRFWEGKFAQIRPLKRGGGRRYYRPEDVDLLRGIQHLLYGDGYTIKGVQKLLRENGVKFVVAAGRREPATAKQTVKPAPQPAPAVEAVAPPPAPASTAVAIEPEIVADLPTPPPVPVAATPSGSLGGAPHFAPVVTTPEPQALQVDEPANEPPPQLALPIEAPAAEPVVHQDEIDEEAETRRIETAAKLLARLKALRREFDTRLQAAKNGR